MSVVSSNPYAALGNDPEYDSDREEVPVKVKENPTARSGKRNAPAEPTAAAPKNAATQGQGDRGNNSRRGGMSGNEGAYRDRNVGSASNRGKPTEGREENRHDRAGARGPRGDYGGGGRATTRPYDRHSRAVGGDSEKQAAHGWGANEGNAELADETAGDAIAQAEQKDALVNDGDAAAETAEAEPEDNSISYADYLAQQAEKKLALGGSTLEPRKPNEGSKQDKKWANAKPITREEEDDFISGPGAKGKRERERKQKHTVDINHEFVEQPDRGGRGGFRGGRGRGDGNFRGRGEFRGGRGDGRGRGGGRGGGDRGGRGGGEYRGGGDRGGARNGPRGANLNPEDTSAFPNLGS